MYTRMAYCNAQTGYIIRISVRYSIHQSGGRNNDTTNMNYTRAKEADLRESRCTVGRRTCEWNIEFFHVAWDSVRNQPGLGYGGKASAVKKKERKNDEHRVHTRRARISRWFGGVGPGRLSKFWVESPFTYVWLPSNDRSFLLTRLFTMGINCN